MSAVSRAAVAFRGSVGLHAPETTGDGLRGARILLVGNDPEYFLMHRLAFAGALSQEGVDLHVAIPFMPEDPRFKSLDFPLHRIALSRGSRNPLDEIRAMRAILEVSRKVAPIIVHHVTIKPIMYGSIAARLLRTPVVVNSVTGLGYIFSSSNRDARIMRSVVVPALRLGCNRRDVTMLFENADDLEVYRGYGISSAATSLVVPSSGIDVDSFEVHAHREDSVTVMFLGRMLYDKGVREFAAAARAVKRRRPEIRFVLVGGSDPNPESISEGTLREWQSEGLLEHWGWRSDIPAVLQSADILCLPSYREGLPRALLEGGASGLALITTDVPGCRDAIIPGRSGLLVPVRDSEALANAILDLAESAARRTAMGAEARMDVRARFSVTSVVAQTRAAYRHALDRVEGRH
jgi:glycosyltransferase involved in cell wall biosynthesis